MNTLHDLLSRFRSGDALPPIVLSDADLVEAVNFLKGTHFVDLYDLKSEYIDSVFVFASESGTLKIEQTRDIIEQSAVRSSGEYSIFVIERIDTLTLQAGNSLLKVFEDVPDRVLFLLTSAGRKEQMLETLASRVIFVSSNVETIVLSPEIVRLVDTYFDADDKAGLLGYLYREKLEKEDYLGVLHALKWRILSGHITDPAVMKKVEDGIVTLSSTNANARWVVDEIALRI